MTLLIVLVAPIAGKTSDRFGSRWLMGTGMALLAVQLFYFSRLGLHESYWALLPAMIVGGFGMALVMTPSAAAAMSGVPVAKAGVGSAVLNSARQVGGSVGIALIGAIVAHEAAGRRTPEAFVDGFSTSLVVASLIALAGAGLAILTIRAPRREESAAPVSELAA
jgi:DHA2 family methylenomycin A resistance protein-like MFS transporter